MAVSPLRRQALLERERALAVLRAAWGAAASDGRGRLVLVAGEAGAGKTALVRSFCGEVEAHVLQGACDPLFTPRPLGAFLDLVEEARDAHDVVSTLLRTTAPTVLVLEDVHWADEATLDALRLLARKVESASLLAVATYRDDELDRLHPLRIVLGELATAPSIARVSVPRLSRAAVVELAEGSGIDADELHRITGGNPFFVTEVLAAPASELPATVRDAVLARVARLGIQARALLEAVATVPPRAEPWLLDAVAGESTEALDECVASGMLVARDGAVEFRHELARLAVIESIQPVRAQMFHRLALAALEAPPLGAPDHARLAHHAEAAGDGGAVLRHGVAAAERAAELGAYREAAAQYGRVLRFDDGLRPAERADLLERRAGAFYLTDDQVEAIAALEEAIACYREARDVRREASALSGLVQFLNCRGAVAAAERAARDAVALLDGLEPGPELAEALHAVARVRLGDEDCETAIELGGKAVEIADACGDTSMSICARITVGTAHIWRDGMAEADVLADALALAERQGSHEQVVRALHNLAAGAVLHRAHESATRYLDAGLRHCEELELDLWRLSLLGRRVRSELDTGRWEDASATAARLIEDLRDSPEPRFQGLLIRALVRARRGDPNVHEPLAAAAAVDGEDFVMRAELAASTAEIAWLEGRPDAVREATDEAFAMALERRSPWPVGQLAYWRRKAGIEEDAPAAAAEPYAHHLAGDWAAAAAAWEALGCPYELALALSEADDEAALRWALDEARALGARPLATMVTRRLRDLGVRGVTRGPRPSTLANAAALTAREVEVLQLVAEGLRNAAIAERLVVSTRTVDHHVSSILRKLEVGSRGEAVVAGQRLGLLL